MALDNLEGPALPADLEIITFEKNNDKINGKGPVAKFFSDKSISELLKVCKISEKDSVFFVCNKEVEANKFAGVVRQKIAEELNIIDKKKLHTVCQEAACPNIFECWSKKHATFMIMGDTCTRACAFCDVKTGKPTSLDIFEPIKISNAVKKLNLKHVVITSVDRDDLVDGGANHFHDVIIETRKQNPKTTIEVLTPDFLRKGDSYKIVVEAKPDVFNHNIETVPGLYRQVRPGSRYFSSLELLKNTKKINKNIFTKSGLMVGLGEYKDEIIQNMGFVDVGRYSFIFSMQ